MSFNVLQLSLAKSNLDYDIILHTKTNGKLRGKRYFSPAGAEKWLIEITSKTFDNKNHDLRL